MKPVTINSTNEERAAHWTEVYDQIELQIGHMTQLRNFGFTLSLGEHELVRWTSNRSNLTHRKDSIKSEVFFDHYGDMWIVDDEDESYRVLWSRPNGFHVKRSIGVYPRDFKYEDWKVVA